MTTSPGRLQVEIDRLREENKRLREALERLGSSEAMTVEGLVTPITKELRARMEFARAALEASR